MQINWYILFTLVAKQEQLCETICKQGVHAFVPMMEYYRRDRRAVAVKPMFPGYIFVRTKLSQDEFDALLYDIGIRKQGLIKQLKEEGVTAMREKEIEFFSHLLDEQGISRMSYGYMKGSRAVVTEGPLGYFQEHIVKVDRHNRLAWLDFEFMNRRVQAGMTMSKENQPVSEPKPEENVLADGTILDIEELKSKMMGL